MERRRTSARFAIAALVCGALGACVVVWENETRRHVADSEIEPEWIGARGDSICGLDDPAMLSRPAVVQYERAFAETPEAKKILAEKIDPRSAEGVALRQAAADRVRDACEVARVAGGHCSVWKKLRHRDGRVIPDLTDEVLRSIAPPKPREP